MSKKKPAPPPAAPVVDFVQPPLNLARHAHLRQGYSQRGRLVGGATFGTRTPLSTPTPVPQMNQVCTKPEPAPAAASAPKGASKPHPMLQPALEPKRRAGKFLRELLRKAYFAANAGEIERAEALIAAAEAEMEADHV